MHTLADAGTYQKGVKSAQDLVVPKVHTLRMMKIKHNMSLKAEAVSQTLTGTQVKLKVKVEVKENGVDHGMHQHLNEEMTQNGNMHLVSMLEFTSVEIPSMKEQALLRTCFPVFERTEPYVNSSYHGD